MKEPSLRKFAGVLVIVGGLAVMWEYKDTAPGTAAPGDGSSYNIR